MKKRKRSLPKVTITDAKNGEFKISVGKTVPKWTYEILFCSEDSLLEIRFPIKIKVI